MAFTQGDPLPSVTTTQDKTTTAPGYYTDYLTNLSKIGTAATQRPAGEMVAGYDPLQTQGYGALSAASTAYQPGLQSAEQTANLAAQGMTPELIQRFMNPYTQNVVDEMARQSQIALQKNLPTLKAGFVGTGGLGSQRYAGALGQSLADVQSNLTTAQTGALQKGYADALDAAYKQSGLYNTAATQQAALAAQEQALGLTGSQALTKAGAERQAYEQARLDAPLKIASNAANLMRGFTIPTSESQKTVAPGQQSQFGTSTLSNITGVLGLLGAVNTNSPIAKSASGFINKLLGIKPSLGSDAATALYNYFNSNPVGWQPYASETGDANYDGTIVADPDFDASSAYGENS
jgi:hypothetical protein